MKNWWIKTRVDGAGGVGAGPKSEAGGFTTTIFQRDEGKSVTAVIISGYADTHGNLALTVRINDKDGGAPITATFDTER